MGRASASLKKTHQGSVHTSKPPCNTCWAFPRLCPFHWDLSNLCLFLKDLLKCGWACASQGFNGAPQADVAPVLFLSALGMLNN